VEQVESTVVELFLKRFTTLEMEEWVVEYWRNRNLVDVADLGVKLAGLQGRQRKLARRLESIDQQYMDEEITALEIRRFRRTVVEEGELVRTSIKEIEAQLSQASAQDHGRGEIHWRIARDHDRALIDTPASGRSARA